MAMEKRLEDLMKAFNVASDIENLDGSTPILMRKSNPAINKTVSFICSVVEPTQMVLPLNVVWFNFDKSSSFYNTALKRVSKEAPESGEFEHSWKPLYYYDEAMEAQYYDEEDQGAIGDAQKVPIADMETFGIVKLFENPSEGEEARVILDTDARLSDARAPLEHMHDEIPATMFAHSTGHLTMVDSAPVIGATIVAKNATECEWRKLKDTDIDTTTP